MTWIAPGDELGYRRAIAAIMHRDHVDAGHRLEQLAVEVRRASRTGRPHVDLAGIGLGIGDELGNGFRRKRGIDDHHIVGLHRARDRCDVADEIELEILIDRRVPRVRCGSFKQRIAIGTCPHDRFGGEVASGAGAVFDDELLAEPLGDHLPGEPCHDVVDAAGGIADQQTAPAVTDRSARLATRPSAGSAGALAANCRNRRRGSFMDVSRRPLRDAHEGRSML